MVVMPNQAKLASTVIDFVGSTNLIIMFIAEVNNYRIRTAEVIGVIVTEFKVKLVVAIIITTTQQTKFSLMLTTVKTFHTC